MTQITMGIVLVVFGITNICIGMLQNKTKKSSVTIQSLKFGSPRAVIVNKNKIRWEYDNGSGFEIAFTKLK